MKKISLFILTAVAAAFIAACGGAANNAPGNTTRDAAPAKPAAAAPTVDALFAMDKAANEAWIKGDAKHFEGFLSDKFVSSEMGQRMDKTGLLKMIGTFKCDVKTWALEDPQMAMINADTAVISYKGTFDGSCTGPDGKAMKLPSPIRAASVYVREGEKWMGAFHGENLIIDPKNPPASPAKSEAKKEEPKKEEPKKEGPKKDDKAAADAKTTENKPTADANTDSLVKLHQSGWEAWKAKDAKKFEEITASNLSALDPMGSWWGTKADTIKHWTTMNCEGVTTVKVSDGFATALSPTVEVLTSKGTADGTCNGQKNGDIYHTAFYVKDGDTWKLAFLFESAGM